MRIDLHVHTSLHSSCSLIDPAALIPAALRAGLNALVITEHGYQWTRDELEALRAESGMPGFPVMAGFEYTTTRGDLLVYGLDAVQANDFAPGMTPIEAARLVHDLGGVCVAAHPTREGLDFDMTMTDIGLAALEVCSTNLRNHERRLAMKFAQAVGIPVVAASDAHVISDVGRYATEFEGLIQSGADLKAALKNGKFELDEATIAEIGIL